ncbi:MAG TPA: hypothetical protein VE863_19790, partial [Pyrinomonadaceae bacterium]|nr:hypothetical protein [Pyrinomonadaceae bacterium]
MIKKFLTATGILSLALFAASCSRTDNAATTNANADNTAVTTTENPGITTAGPDDSEITTTNQNGVRTETRTFHNNPRVAKVVVTTRDGNTTATAYAPNGEERQMSAPEKALNATGEAIADSVGWVKDKGSDVVDKTKDTGKTVGDKTVEGTEKVVDKGKDVGKDVGSKTKEGADVVVDRTKEGVK